MKSAAIIIVNVGIRLAAWVFSMSPRSLEQGRDLEMRREKEKKKKKKEDDDDDQFIEIRQKPVQLRNGTRNELGRCDPGTPGQHGGDNQVRQTRIPPQYPTQRTPHNPHSNEQL